MEDKKEIPAGITPEQLAQIVQQTAELLQQQQTTPRRGRPRKTEAEKLRGYKFTIHFDKDLEQFVKEMAWKNRSTITQWMNDLVRKEKERYFRECEAQGIDPTADWEKYEV